MYCRNQYLQIPVEYSYYENQRNMPKCLVNYLATPGVGVPWISRDMDDWMGAKIKNQKKLKKSLDQNLTPQKSHAEFMSHKDVFAELCARNMWELSRNLQIVLNTPKNPFVNQAT